MTASVPAYRFETPQQWAACLSTGLPEDLTLGPADGAPADVALEGAPVVAIADGGLLWLDEEGVVRRDDCAGPRLGPVRRLVADDRSAWLLTGDALVRIDPGSLQHLASFDAVGVIDIAADGRGGVWELRADHVTHRGANGRTLGSLALAEPGEQIAAAGSNLFVYGSARLRRLAGDGSAAAVEIAIDPAFQPDRLAGAGTQVLIQGRWQSPAGEKPGFLLLDANGDTIVRGRWQADPLLYLLSAKGMLALFPGGVRRLYPALVGAGGRRWLTPAMEADTLAGTWLRAEASARLPEGATLRLRWAASADEGLRSAIDALAADETLSQTARIAAIDALLRPCWSDKTLTYSGAATTAEGPPERFAFPLHEAQGHLLWLELSLHRNEAACAPGLSELAVLHDAPSLVDHLPAIYRSPSGDGDGTLRRLVGILEATTQDLDERIGQLAERLSAQRSPSSALEALAEMLGIPFHPGLSTTMQRGLIGAAPGILLGRGTRAGLQATLEALFGARAFRIVDTTERLIPVALGLSRLPAMLSGASARVPRLNARLVLNRTPLCGAAGDGLIAPPSPEIIVVIPATARERANHGQAVEHVLAALIPAGLRLRVRWIVGTATTRPVTADVLSIPAAPAPLRFGDGQRLGAATLAGERRPRLADDGIRIGHRLV
ncbi:phage tail protein [Sphingosinicella sp. BN140058]|uniref:phage tail protein n=1 Tax=Sphingosinicella sp. BN140058 TaxID=1892855 RepID=UPI001012B94B|nr:phage tail protein [Sphingosinicella sp. BN140058]QAY79326.1 hypothetical protein ETR14_24375 [Sphingosinicella sp. BN140058]